jgi:hypothetical protein
MTTSDVLQWILIAGICLALAIVLTTYDRH